MESVVGGMTVMGLRLQTRPYAFELTRALQTASGNWQLRRGWLLRLDHPDGRTGWGEVAPLADELDPACARSVAALSDQCWSAKELEQHLVQSPPAVAFGLGAALAEIQGLVGQAGSDGWLPAPPSAHLLPAGDAMPPVLEDLLTTMPADGVVTVKWKVAALAESREQRLLEQLLQLLPANARLRLDANGGWNLPVAQRWAERLQNDNRLEWLEQPLAAGDWTGHQSLLKQVPVALDEGLRDHPHWRQAWMGWQVRRPLLEGDPRPLLRQLQQGLPRLMLSTAFETGIGGRWLAHLAALQRQGPTPAAPGLAPGWCPAGPLFSTDPAEVWTAAETQR